MNQRKQNFALGLTAIVFLALFIATVIFLYPVFKPGGKRITVLFRHDEGMAPLKQGSPVLLGGSLEVGRVARVGREERTPPDNPNRPRNTYFVVELEIARDLNLYGDCRITTGEPAIGGSGFVLINDVGDPNEPLEEPVVGHPPQSLAAFIGTLSNRLLADGGLVDQLNKAVDPEHQGSVLFKVMASLDDLNQMTSELKRQLHPDEERAVIAKVHRILDDVNAATAALREETQPGRNDNAIAQVHRVLDHLDAALQEAASMLEEDRPLVLQTLENVEQATRRINEDVLARLRNELDPDNETGTLGRVHAAMDHVNRSLENLETITNASERMLTSSRPQIEETLDNVNTTSQELKHGVQELVLNPSKLFWGPSGDREKQLAVFLAARNFAEAARQLDTASGRLESILNSLPEDQPISETLNKEIESIHATIRAAFQRFEQTERVLWDQLK